MKDKDNKTETVIQEPAKKNNEAKIEAGDPFDLSEIKLSQDFTDIGVDKIITTIYSRTPDKQWFVRVHPDEGFRIQTAVIELKDDGKEYYLVSKHLWSSLPEDIIPITFFTAINRQNNLFLWPVKIPREDGRRNHWHSSAIEAVTLAEKYWVKVVPKLSLGAYEVYKAAGNLPEPEWPTINFQELIKIAFKDRLIQDISHPVLKKLRGEI